MSLSDSIESDPAKVFLRTEDFAESILYVPRCGKLRTINAIVDREPGQILLDGDIVVPNMIISVHNHRTTGIDHRDIDAGDKVRVAIKPKGDATDHTFRVVQQSDEGMLDIAIL